MKKLIYVGFVSVFLMGTVAAVFAKPHQTNSDISGSYSAFPSSVLKEGVPADAAFFLANLGRLLSDDTTARADAREQLVAVDIIQSEESLLVRMYDDTGAEVLKMTKQYSRGVLDGRDVVCIRTFGTLGEGIEGGRKSRIVDTIRMRRDGESLLVHIESVQTFPRWLWLSKEEYTHKSTYVFLAISPKRSAAAKG